MYRQIRGLKQRPGESLETPHRVQPEIVGGNFPEVLGFQARSLRASHLDVTG